MAFLKAAATLFSLFVTTALSCTPEQPVVSIGDYECEVSFGFVSASACQGAAVNVKREKTGEISQLNQMRTNFYEKASINYTKHAYFFKTNVSCDELYTWSIVQSQTLGPYEFSVRNLTKSGHSKFFLIADMDLSNHSLYTQNAMKKIDFSQYDGFIHAGDYAYDVEDNNGTKGDQYFNYFSNIITRVPYVVVAGNHENYDVSWLFNYRLMMPDYSEIYRNNFYTVNNYDYVIYLVPGSMNAVLDYVKKELEKSQNDSSIAWRVVVSHRPIYCGEFPQRRDCTDNFYYFKAFEDLYRRYKVNLLLGGHEHFYERLRVLDDMFTLRNVQTTIEDGAKVYTELVDPLTIIGGCAGNVESISNQMQLSLLTDSFVANNTQCYAEITFTNDTFTHTLYASKNLTILDKTIVRLSTPPAPAPGPQGWQAWTLFIPVAFVAFVLVAFTASKLGVRTAPVQIGDGRVYNKVSAIVPGSTLSGAVEANHNQI